MGFNVPLDLEERKKIKAMIDQGISARKMGLTLDRAFSCIEKEIHRNGGRKNYDPFEAHKQAETRKAERIEKVRKMHKSDKRKGTFFDRLVVLEMQVDILMDRLDILEKTNNKR